MQPGIYPNMSAAEYHAVDACSASRLKALKQSPAHCRQSIENPRSDTPALVSGSAVHAAVLEPDRFASEFVVRPTFGRTKAEQEARDAWEYKARGKSIITADDAETCAAIVPRLHAHKMAGPIIRAKSHVELSGFWIDSDTSLLCKCRWDAVSEKPELVVDLKTTTDASPRAFAQSIFKFGYHRQGAWYLDAARILGLRVRYYCIIAVEKSPPYGIAVYRLNTEGTAIDLGRRENAVLKRRYAECKESGEWPSYPEIITDIELPKWAVRQTEEEYGYEFA